MKLTLPRILLACYILLFAITAINPYDRGVWLVENIPMLMIVGIIIWVQCYHHQFSPLSFLFISFLILLHTIGAHYTFEHVPFGFITELFDFERNHFDRMAHFTVGFYAYPIAELLLKKRLVQSTPVLLMFPIFAIFTVAGCYELFEWQFAIYAQPNAGLAVLGSQGDQWDAQKDILSDGLGAVSATLIFWIIHRHMLAINSHTLSE